MDVKRIIELLKEGRARYLHHRPPFDRFPDIQKLFVKYSDPKAPKEELATKFARVEALP